MVALANLTALHYTIKQTPSLKEVTFVKFTGVLRCNICVFDDFHFSYYNYQSYALLTVMYSIVAVVGSTIQSFMARLVSGTKWW